MRATTILLLSLLVALSGCKADAQFKVALTAENYDQYIVAEFTRNWNLPSTLRDDSLTVKARVTIASDGRVVSASVSARSGDSALDRSVESVLQRVKQVRGFPSGVSSENRTYTIKFKPEFNLGSG